MGEPNYHVIIGTKAQLVKMAPVMRSMSKHKLPYKLVFTGQHQETMSDLISSFALNKPDIVLYSKDESDSPTKLISWFVKCSTSAWKKRKLFQQSKGFIVHGDTMSTLWGALTARLLGIPVIHIEAGLRSYNYRNPFPEELIRVAVTKLSHLLFAPSLWACNNIKRTSKNKVINTKYNTILDSLKYALEQNIASYKPKYSFFVFSIHRAENILNNQQFEQIMHYMLEAASITKVKLILHPITRRKLVNTHWQQTLEEQGIELIPRMNYIDFMKLLSQSNGLITDGGSNQEESALLGLPCLLMRKHTERTEGLDSNVTLSKLEHQVIKEFFQKYSDQSWLKNPLPDFSPSDEISHYLSTNKW